MTRYPEAAYIELEPDSLDSNKGALRGMGESAMKRERLAVQVFRQLF